MWQKSPRDMFNQIWWHLYDSLSWQEKSDCCWISTLPQSWTQTQFLGKSDSALSCFDHCGTKDPANSPGNPALKQRGRLKDQRSISNPLSLKDLTLAEVFLSVLVWSMRSTRTSPPQHGWFVYRTPTSAYRINPHHLPQTHKNQSSMLHIFPSKRRR